MRAIEGNLTEELKSHIGKEKVAIAEAYPIATYRALVEQIAKLAYLNKDYLLFFRGQHTDYINKAGSSTFYPSIYRGEYLQRKEIRHKFDILNGASRLLAQNFVDKGLPGASELKRKRYIQWSILQHYEVCGTPLLDFSHSIRVASSFAIDNNENDEAYFFVFGLPYITNRISINSEHDLVNVRLLSICPPNALRPYFQDGYLAGTEDVVDEYDSKSELDFNNRLIAKFKFRNNKRFWGSNFTPIPHEALYPKKDEVELISKIVKEEADRELQTGDIGEFLSSWAKLEHFLLEFISGQRHRPTVNDAVRNMLKNNYINKEEASNIHNVRKFRNELVHYPNKINKKYINEYITIIDDIYNNLQRNR